MPGRAGEPMEGAPGRPGTYGGRRAGEGEEGDLGVAEGVGAGDTVVGGVGGVGGGGDAGDAPGVACAGAGTGVAANAANGRRSSRAGSHGGGRDLGFDDLRRSFLRLLHLRLRQHLHRALGHRQVLDARLDLLDEGTGPSRTQGVGRRPLGQRGAAPGGGRARLLRRVAQDDLPWMGQLLPLQDGLDDVGIDVSVVAFDAHADRLQLEDQILIRDLHHARKVLDPNLSHTLL